MESGSTFDRVLPGQIRTVTSTEPSGTAEIGTNLEQGMQPASSTRSAQTNVSAALAAANAALPESEVRFPGDDDGRSLAEMAQQDLDTTLQLLTDRAQYITGSSGAAIALRREGKNDMLCRATTGSNAPELGTLLSTEFGLSGESVRTRQPLRCDDAQRDTRVNQEVCSQMGIASVVVMPVVHDDEVLGVFELFSGKAHAFSERDLLALERLSEMVETAVRLARAAEDLPERLKTVGVSAEDPDGILEAQDPVVEVVAQSAGEAVAEPEVRPIGDATRTTENLSAAPAAPMLVAPEPNMPLAEAASASPAAAHLSTSTAESSAPAVPKRPLLWSAALNVNGDAPKPSEQDQSHVPPVLRNLRKCEACGFPISRGRVLCVECEEKKWRGQLRAPHASAARPLSGAAAAAAPAPEVQKEVRKPLAAPKLPPATRATEPKLESKVVNGAPSVLSLNVAVRESPAAQPSSPDLVFSAAAGPTQSWLARNKFIVGAMLLVAASVAAILLLR